MAEEAILVLCALSRKRLEMIEEDPSVVDELLEARFEQEIRGLLDLGPRGGVLAKVLSTGGPDLLDALLARTGKERPGMAGKLLAPGDVKRIAKALAGVDATWIDERCKTVGGEKAKGLHDAFRQVQTLYVDAASREDAMLVVVE
jgi:hypothetical protein